MWMTLSQHIHEYTDSKKHNKAMMYQRITMIYRNWIQEIENE